MDIEANSGTMKKSVDDQTVVLAKAMKKVDVKKRSHSMSSFSRNSFTDFKMMTVPTLNTSKIEQDIVAYETGAQPTDLLKKGTMENVNDVMNTGTEGTSNWKNQDEYDSYISLLNYANYGVSDIHANNTRRSKNNYRNHGQGFADTNVNVKNSNDNYANEVGSMLADNLKIEDPTKRTVFGTKIDVIELFMKTDKSPEDIEKFPENFLNNKMMIDKLLMPPPAPRPHRKTSIALPDFVSSVIINNAKIDASVIFNGHPTLKNRTYPGLFGAGSKAGKGCRKRPASLNFSSPLKKKIWNYPFYDLNHFCGNARNRPVVNRKSANVTKQLFPRTPAEAVNYNTSNTAKPKVKIQGQLTSSLESIQGIVSAVDDPTIKEEVVEVDDVLEQEKYDCYLLCKSKE